MRGVSTSAETDDNRDCCGVMSLKCVKRLAKKEGGPGIALLNAAGGVEQRKLYVMGTGGRSYRIES